MKLKCELQTVYRSGTAGTPPSRKTQGMLVLSGRAPELLVTAFTPRNRRGLRYRVASLARVFTRHAHAGKTSLSFSQPEHDLLVTGDPVQVRAFLQQLAGAVRGAPSQPAPAEPPRQVTVSQLQRAPTRVVARSSAEYLRAFPAGLLQLAAPELRLRRVEERLLRLSQLRSLDLSGNRLRRLPALDGRLPQLCELRLADNQLERLEPLADRPRGSQLAYLDVSGNRLIELPATLAFLTHLHFLNAADNRLTALPDCMASLARLRVLNVANNRLGWLPAQLERMQLLELDTHGNAGAGPEATDAAGGVPTLLHLSAGAVSLRLRGRSLGAADLPVCLLELLVQRHLCDRCGAPCFPAGGARATLRPGPLRHRQAALVHPTAAPLPLRLLTCHRCVRRPTGAAGRRLR